MAKKEKKEKVKKVKKGNNMPPVEGEEPQKKKGPKLILIILSAVLILAAVAIVLLAVVLPRFGINLIGGGDAPPEESVEPEPEPVYYDLPESFQLGDLTVVSMDPLERNGVQAFQEPRFMYTYTGLEDAGAEAEAYARLLRGNGFSIVDEAFVRCDAPDYTTPSGEMLLAKDLPKAAAPEPEAGEDGEPVASPEPAEEQPDMVATVRLTWSPSQCEVLGEQAEGKVTSPPKGTGASGGAAMSLREAEEFIAGLEPSVLGLSGETMETYRVYAQDGAVKVDGQVCMQMKVYDRSGNANAFAGTYLLSSDGQHLYRLDEKTDTVEELELP